MSKLSILLTALLLAGCTTPITVAIPNHFPTNVVWNGSNVIFQRKVTRMTLPDGSTAPVRPGVAKAAAAPIQNPFNVTRSMVCTSNDPGVLYTTGGGLAGLTLTNAGLFATSKTLKMLNAGPVRQLKGPVRFTTGTGASLLILPDGPGMAISWSPWDAGINVALIDSTNMVVGKTYTLQATVNMLTWNGTGQSVTWSSTDPSAYWRAVRAVPSDSAFVELYRVVTP